MSHSHSYKRNLEGYENEHEHEQLSCKRFNSNIEHTISKGDHACSNKKENPLLFGDKWVHYWFTILLNEEDMKSSISVVKDLATLKSLTRVCKLVSTPARAFLSNHFWFSQEDISFHWHTPKKLKGVTNFSLINESNHAHLVTHLILGYYFNAEIDGSLLPPNLTNITFGYQYNSSFHHLPSKITTITFGTKFNIHEFQLPPSVLNVTFGSNYNKNIDEKNISPKSQIKQISFGYEYNRITDTLPQSLTRLVFGFRYNSPIQSQSLPPNLVFLQFGFDYNQKTDNLLPSRLKHLVFGWSYNQSVDHLPPNLTHLEFGYKFDREVEKLPKTITHLKFGYLFNREVFSLPDNLSVLEFGGKFSQNVNYLPLDISLLTFSRGFEQLLNLDNFPNTLVTCKVLSDLLTIPA